MDATRRWFRRNRTNLLIGAGVIGAGYVAGQYVLGKIQEARQRMSEDKVAKENLRRRFEQNQEDCTYTVLALLPTIREEIVGALPVEQITEQLQQERQERLRRLGGSEAASSELPSGPPSATDDAASLQSGSYVHASQMTGSSSLEGSTRSKRSKAQLWQEMKINSITRALTLIYTIALLTMLTRIQLNLLGRRTYLASVVALTTPPAPQDDSKISLENKDDDNYDNMYGNDFETNRKYLTFSWWLLHRGSKQIMERVMAVVNEVFGAVNIREDVSLDRLSELIMQVRKKIEGATEEERRGARWLQYLLPPRDQESFVIRQSNMSESSEESPSPEARIADEDPMTASAVEAENITDSLRRLLDETSDLIDSPTFSHVLTRLLDASFSHLVDFHIATEAYKTIPTSAPDAPRITEITEDKKCKVAHILPIFCKQAHAMAGEYNETTNEYLTVIDQVHDLGAFAAVIYSSNFEYEAPDSSASTTAPQSDSSAQPSPPTVATVAEVLPDQNDEPVAETEPRTLFEGSSFGEREGVLPTSAAQESAPAVAEDLEPGQGGFESAWRKALAEEDGKQAP